MLIFPCNVNFLLFQVCKELSKSRILAPKLRSSASVWLCEKKTPRESIGSFGHLKPKGVSWLFFHCPYHIASVLEVLISKPDKELNSLRKSRSSRTESLSRTKTVVSSAYWATFISGSSTRIPLTEALFFKRQKVRYPRRTIFLIEDSFDQRPVADERR